MTYLNKSVLKILTVFTVGVFVLLYVFITNGLFGAFFKNPEDTSSVGVTEESELAVQAELEWEKDIPTKIPQKEVSIIDRAWITKNPRIETDLPPAEVFRLAGNVNNDIEYWKQVLVEEDRDEKKYIVIPSNGLVVPIKEFAEDSLEFDKMINGREIDINSILEHGALEYSGTSINGYGEEWNKMVFAHSSYWKGEAGRYKTHFQKIIELDAWEEVWIYEKNSLWWYTQYRYETQESYNTSEYDTSIFTPPPWKTLTLFTCTPIGGTEGRWIIKAKYIDTPLNQEEE